jgi:hypothetical protein
MATVKGFEDVFIVIFQVLTEFLLRIETLMDGTPCRLVSSHLVSEERSVFFVTN